MMMACTGSFLAIYMYASSQSDLTRYRLNRYFKSNPAASKEALGMFKDKKKRNPDYKLYRRE